MDENEKDTLSQLGKALLAEWKRKRRWGIFFRFVLVGLVFLFISTLGAITTLPYGGLPDSVTAPSEKHVGLVKVQGPILSGTQAASKYIIDALEMAFENANTAGVIIEINTPGGSPVQSSYIAQAILDLRKKHADKPIYVVISEVCASGGMYIASAADEIYAHPDSVVGSIGVILGGFGFVDAMEKLGVERRVITAGEHKALLDPFQEEKPDELTHVQSLLDEIHGRFIERVQQGRAGKLVDDPKLFSGLIWTGHRAKELGLIDGFGNTNSVAMEKFQTDKIHEYQALPAWFNSIWHRLGTQIGHWLQTTYLGMQSAFIWR